MNYGYDGFGDRVSQTFGTATTHYFFDPTGGIPQLLVETSGGGSNPATYYLPGLGQDNGKMSYFGTDALGTVRQITDSNGVMQYAANFDPYGSLLEQNFGTANTSLGYTGAPSDPSGLVYLNARFYNPSIGSFQTHDPFSGELNDPVSLNGYGYSGDNPSTYNDPSGKCFDPISLVVCLAAGALIGGFTYGAVKHLTDNNEKWATGDHWGAVGDSIGQGLVWGAGSAIVAAGIGSVAFGLPAIADAATTAAEPVLTWFLSHPGIAMTLTRGAVGGLIAGELEWSNEFNTNRSRGMDTFNSTENLNGGQIAGSAVFGAITSGVWQAAGVWNILGKEGLGAILPGGELAFMKMTSSGFIPAATAWGGIISAAAYMANLAITNRRQGNNSFDGFTWSDFFSSTAAGSVTNWLTASAGESLTPKPWERYQSFTSVMKGTSYAIIGVGVGILQSGLVGVFSKLAGKSSSVFNACTVTLNSGFGPLNASSLIPNPGLYAITSFMIGFTGNLRANVCPTQ